MNQPIRQIPGEKGFAPLVLMIIVGAIVVMTGGGVYYYRQSAGPSDASAPGIQAAPKSSTIRTPKATSKPTSSPTPPKTQPSPTPILIHGKTLEERLAEANARVHTVGSGEHIRKNFPDIALVYTDDGTGAQFPNEIIPFRYYYSSEANTTFGICKPDLTTFVCEGKLNKLMQGSDLDSGRCNLAEQLKGDPRL